MYKTNKKQVRECTHGVTVLAHSSEFDLRLSRMAPVMFQLTGWLEIPQETTVSMATKVTIIKITTVA
jgi:hypothetical protein